MPHLSAAMCLFRTPRQTNKQKLTNSFTFTNAHNHTYRRSRPPPLTINPRQNKKNSSSPPQCVSMFHYVPLFYFSSVLVLRLVLLPREIAGAKPRRRRTKLPLTPLRHAQDRLFVLIRNLSSSQQLHFLGFIFLSPVLL